MRIYQPIFTHKKYQGLYGKILSILYNMGGKIVVVLRIHGARSMFLLFCDCKDTGSE